MSTTQAPYKNPDFSLEELVIQAAPLLSRLNVDDQRVQGAPDSRTIRYYQSSGLLDRPLRYDGRTARYGRRHLLQLVAIRSLQTQGLSLAQVQSHLAGASDAELERLASAAEGVPAPIGRRTTASTAETVVSSDNAPPAGAPITAAEIAPGVIITIDSRMQPQSARLIERMRLAIQQMIQQETQS